MQKEILTPNKHTRLFGNVRKDVELQRKTLLLTLLLVSSSPGRSYSSASIDVHGDLSHCLCGTS